MKNKKKTKERSIHELTATHRRDAGPEKSGISHKQAKHAPGILHDDYREIFDKANDAFFIHDAKTGAILDVNEKMCEMYGRTREEVRRKVGVAAMSANVPPYTQKEIQEWIRKTSHEGPQLFEWQARHKDGTVFWVEVNLKRARIGNKDRILAVVRDITERKRAEEELLRKNTELHAAYEQLAATEEELWQNYDELSQKEQALCESEEKYRTIFKNAGDAIAIHDLEGHFVEVNDVICRRFGYTRDEMLQMNVGDVNVPDHARNVGEKIHELTKKGHIIFETVHIARDGRQIPAEVSAVLFHLGKKPLVMSIARDITERKQAEEQLRQFAE